jgi:hypothetical protein
MTNGSTSIVDNDGRFHFTADDIGQPIWVIGAVPPISSETTENGMLRTVIVAVSDSTHATTQEPATADTDASSNATLFRQRGWPLIGSGNLQFSLTSHDVASFTFLDELPKPEAGQPVLFRISGDDIFGGTIDNIVGENVPGSPLGKWAIDCVSWDQLSYKRTTGEPTFATGSPAVINPQNGLFTNKTVSEIIKFLIVHALGDEGLDFVGAADGPVIPTFSASYAQCGDAFDQLVKAGSDTSTFLHWFTDPNKKIWLADQSTFTAPWSIDENDCGSILAAVQCTWDRSEFIDRAIVRLSNEISDPITESFVGDSSTKTFQMSNPVASTPTITENGTPVSVGILGINTGSAWYWNQGSTAITQDPAGAPIGPSVTLAVTAPQFVAGIVSEINPTAVQLRQEIESGTGLYENVIQQDNPATETEGQTLATAIAGQYGIIPKRIQIKTYRPGLKIGQNIPVTLSMFGLSNAPFCISDVEITTDDNVILWTVTAIGSPLLNWDYRATLATLRPGSGSGGIGGGGQPGPQMYWRTIDINDTTVGNNIAPNLTNQGTGRGIKITGVLRKAISSDLVVRVNSGEAVLGTLTIPHATPIKTKVETAITDQNLVSGATMTWDITAGDSQQDKNGVATITVQWGVVTQVQVMGQWQGPWDGSADYITGDAVSFDGSSWISLQDDNTGNEPDTSPAFWDLVALHGSPGIAGVGVPSGGTTGQVLAKASNTDFDDEWVDVVTDLPLTTKGDLLTYGPGGSPVVNQPVRFPVGTNDKVLTADSSQPDGILWRLAQLEAQQAGAPIGSRPIFNFIGGPGITVSVEDDVINGRINITISGTISPSSGSGGVWSLIGFGPVSF